MLFNTVQFAVFFAFVAALNYVLPRRWRGWLLLAASYYFYMCWSVRYILVIIAITLVDYFAGLRIEAAEGRARKAWLAFSIGCNFGLLFVFKYADFFGSAVNRLTGSEIPALHWLLPVGISFHTFQAISYTFDVYRGLTPAERSLKVYALYVAFFPQMVAGPIERPGHLMPQLHEPAPMSRARLASGLRLALWGLVKKTVVADLAAPVVNTVYTRPHDFPGALLALATVLFAVQIYCDFSGYSDIAVGTARVLGYDLTINFRQPYFARSVGEFWQRWHISLSTWFRDYLYIPLGGNRVSRVRRALNIAVVFLASGLWHGASGTFVVWGAAHAFYMLFGQWTKGLREACADWSGLARAPRIRRAFQTCITFALVSAAWIFFRAGSIEDAGYIVRQLASAGEGFELENLFSLGLPRFEMSLLLLAIPAVFAIEHVRNSSAGWISRRSVRWAAMAAAVYSIVFFGVFTRVEFIYFQF
jgi:alginate O-acetyltransferase complex protein AlgI